MAKLPKEVREFLEEYESAPYVVNDPEGLQRMKQIAIDAKREADEMRKKAHGMAAVFSTMCPHEDKVVTTQYVPGDYYDNSYTLYKVWCTMCNKQMFEFDGKNGRYG